MNKNEKRGFNFHCGSHIDILSKSCDLVFFFERLTSMKILKIYRSGTNLDFN